MIKKKSSSPKANNPTEDLQKCQKLLAIAKAEKMRALADLQNVTRRTQTEKSQWASMMISGFIQPLLPSLRELHLGIGHTTDQGLKQTVSKFFDQLNEGGLSIIAPQAGEQIDLEQHEIILSENGKPDVVIRLLEPGWRWRDKVITPAKIAAATK